MKNFFNSIYWLIYRIFPAGRQAYKFKKGFEGMLESNNLKTITKMKVIRSADKKLKQKKILTFNKGNSIHKSKKSGHEVIESVKKEHSEELDEKNLKISKSGKFKNK